MSSITLRLLRWAALPVAGFAMLTVAHAQPYVNVTVGGAVAPGVYGHISVGNNPPPPVINVQPVIVGPVPMGAPPMYVYAPPQHMQYWGQYCGYYRACGYPVYFVEMERHGRWWDHHNVYLRGPEHYRPYEYRRQEARRDERHYDRHEDRDDWRKHEQRGNDNHDRQEERGGHGGHGRH